MSNPSIHASTTSSYIDLGLSFAITVPKVEPSGVLGLSRGTDESVRSMQNLCLCGASQLVATPRFGNKGVDISAPVNCFPHDAQHNRSSYASYNIISWMYCTVYCEKALIHCVVATKELSCMAGGHWKSQKHSGSEETSCLEIQANTFQLTIIPTGCERTCRYRRYVVPILQSSQLDAPNLLQPHGGIKLLLKLPEGLACCNFECKADGSYHHKSIEIIGKY